MVDNKYLPNLLSLTAEIAAKTYKQIIETINIAAKHKACYVNFHPESYKQPILDLDNSKFNLEPQKIDKEKSFYQLLKYLTKIKTQAFKKNIIPFIETVPKYVPSDFEDIEKGRSRPKKTLGMGTEKFIKLAKLRQPICLDFGHTMGQLITEDKQELFEYLYQTAKKIKPAVGLLHVTTNRPPFNGTDSHNGILKKDFDQGVVPNEKQLLKLLKLFKHKDVWLIPEPHDNMIKNHLKLKKIVKKIDEG